jgi:hypothetical protein
MPQPRLSPGQALYWCRADEPGRAAGATSRETASTQPYSAHTGAAGRRRRRSRSAERAAAAQTLGGGGGNPRRGAGGIPRLARQPAGQPRRIAARRQARGDCRARSRGAAGDRAAARLRPRLTQEIRSQTHLDLARTCTARWPSVDPRTGTTRGVQWCLDIMTLFGTRSAYPIWASGHPTASQRPDI